MFAKMKSYCASRNVRVLFVLSISLTLTSPAVAGTNQAANYAFAGPVFGLTAAPDNSLLAADSGAGVVELRKGKGKLVASLPGISRCRPGWAQ